MKYSDDRSSTTGATAAGHGGLTRRQMLSGASALAGLATAGMGGSAWAARDPAHNIMPGMPMPLPEGPRRRIQMLVYPKMVMIDLVAPMTLFTILRADIELVWKDTAPLMTDIGLPVAATTTFDQAAPAPDVLFVPGGVMGTIDCMNDMTVLDFLNRQAEQARYVTSVCTGSLVLAAAGLLRGRRATAHWGVVDLLPLMGATVERSRVVTDGNRITGAGATAGLDFGLVLADMLYGEEAARHAQLILQYAPQPPFHNGNPEQAGPARMKEERADRQWMDKRARAAAEQAAARLGT